VQKLTKEISLLREHTQQIQQNMPFVPNGYNGVGPDGMETTPAGQVKSVTRPQSMFELGDQQRLSQKVKNDDKRNNSY